MSCAILAHDWTTLDKIFGIVKRAYENLPEVLKPKTKTDTRRTYEFVERFDGMPLDSSIYVALKIRGGTVRKLHITESAFIKDRQGLNSGAKQAVPKDGYITEETTANGYNEFYDTWEEARSNPNPSKYDYRTYFYPWFLDDEYSISLPNEIELNKNEKNLIEVAKTDWNIDLSKEQLNWRRWKIKDLATTKGGYGLSGEQLFKQEYPSSPLEAFQSASGNVFDGVLIDKIKLNPFLTKDKLINDKEALLLAGYGITFWELKQVGKNYVIGCDPSDGMGSDFSVVSVWERGDKRQVAQFRGKVRPDELAEIIRDLATYYNRAYVGVENNMLSTILFLSKIYDHYYISRRFDERTKKYTKKIGWTTSSKTRNIMIDDFRKEFEEGNLIINSNLTLSEMKTFVMKENGKREHADGKFDDCLFADMIALQLINDFRTPPRVFEGKPSGF